MSSQDSSSAAAPPRQSSGSTKSSKSTAAKRRRRHREPDRLGWLGGPSSQSRLHSAPAASQEFTSRNEFGSQSSGDVTPHPMEFTPPDGAGNGSAVDLTADSDDDKKQSVNRKSDEWECSRCTLLNPRSESNCTVCGHRRSLVRKSNDEKRQSGESKKRSSHEATESKRSKNQSVDKKKESKSASDKEKSQLWKWTQSQSSSQSKKKQSAKLSTTKLTKKSIPSTDLWIDKHFPKSSPDLCVAPKKVEEVRQWLTSHISLRHSKRNSESNSIYEAPPSQLLILVGSPGIGKSTLLYVLAKELKSNVLKWNDVHTEYVASRGEEYVPYQSQLGSFEEFLVGAGTGMDSVMDDTDKREDDGSVILIEEIPNLYNSEAAQSFRNIMEKHIQRSIVPTVFIFSDVYEGKHKPEELERLIPNRLLYSLQVQILPIQPVTKAKMKKSIESIAKAEGLGRLPTDFTEELHMSSGGDLRHAIFALQFQYATKGRVASNTNSTTKRDVKLSSFHALGKLLYAKRKPKIDDFSDDFPPSPTKPEPQSRLDKWDDGRGPLGFVPEEVLSQTDMNTGSAISFISYHSPDYFTDVTELSRAFDHISDAGSFLDKFGPAEGAYPMGYAASLGGRAIADANKNPAPNQFRHLSAPKVFEVMKKSRDNEIKMDQLRKRLSVGSQQISIGENIGSVHQFVTDSLPYLKNIIPQDVNYALANLHSYARESSTNLSQPDHNDLVLAQQEQEQQAILKDDDLVDDDDW